jgi:hypothetical protein
VSDRRCDCGHRLSKHNATGRCATCERVHYQATLFDSKADRERLAGRHVAGVYTRPEVFESPERYLAALTMALDNLVAEVGLDPFNPEQADWWPQEAREEATS